MGSTLFAHYVRLIVWLCLVLPPVVVSALAIAAARTHPGDRPPPEPVQLRPVLLRLALSGAMVLALFIASLPKMPPFSPGQKLGLGILLGGIAGAIAALFDACSHTWMRKKEDPVRGSSPIALVVMTYSAIITTLFASGFLLQKDDPLEMFTGIGVGVIITAFLHLLPQKISATEEEDVGSFYELFVCVTVAVAGATLLAALHYPNGLAVRGTLHVDRRLVWQIPMFLASIPFWMCALTALIGALFPSLTPAGRGVTMIALAVLKLCVSYPYIVNFVYGSRATVIPVIAGSVTGLLAISLVLRLSSVSDRNPNARWLTAVESASLLSLVVFVCIFLGFRFRAGYGVALTSVAIAAIALSTLPLVAEKQASDLSTFRVTRLLTRVLSVIISFALLRGLLQVVGLTNANISLYTHFVLFGLMLGCIFPFVLDAVRVVASENTPAPRRATGLLSAIAIGIGCAAIAPGLLLLWGNESVAGLFTGLLLCQTVLLIIETATEGNVILSRHAISLISWGIAFPALKTVPLLEPLDSLVTRSEKIYAVVALAVVLLAWTLLNGLIRRKLGVPEGQCRREGRQ